MAQFLSTPASIGGLAALLLAGCAPMQETRGVASADSAPEQAEDALLMQRLGNLPKVRPWPIDWFEPKETVRGAAKPSAPPTSRAAPLIKDAAWSEALAYAQATNTDALIVYYKGAPDRVYYRDGFTPTQLTNTYYLNYFALVLAVGVAVDDGIIDSIDDPVSKYIAEWRGSARDAITVRHLLQMRSGLELYYDNIDPADKATRVFFGSQSTEAALEYPAEDPAGTVFEYNYIVPEILGIVLERATGERYADYLSEKIWQPLGNSDAKVWLDRPGGRPHFNAALFADADDWMRIGAMIAADGMFNGKRIVSADWIEAMATPSPITPNYGFTWLGSPFEAERRLSPEVSYVVKASAPFTLEDTIILDGYGGQRVYISRDQQLVIVRIGELRRNDWDDSRLPNLIAASL